MTNLAEKLAFRTIVLVKIDFWSVTARTLAVIRDIAFATTAYRSYWFVVFLVTPLKVLHKVLIIPRFYIEDQREFVHFELLVFRGMRVIKGPLFEWDVPADKVYQPTVLLIKIVA